MDLNIGPFVPVFPPEVGSFYNLVLRTSAGVPLGNLWNPRPPEGYPKGSRGTLVHTHLSLYHV